MGEREGVGEREKGEADENREGNFIVVLSEKLR